MTQIDSTTSAPVDAPTADGPTRRKVLLTSGAVVAAAAVTAACGSSDSGSAAPTGSATASSGGADAGSGATVETTEISVGGGAILVDEKIVVTQPKAGEYKAFTAVCTHQGCLVSSISEGNISCACHGSVFSGTDGSVVQGPATAPLAELTATVSGTTITVA